MKFNWLLNHFKNYPAYLPYKLRLKTRPDYCIFAVTHKCNARCVMCNFWKNKPHSELNLGEIQKIFRDPLMKNLKTVSLTGGEAILRKDICSVIDIIYDATKAKIDLGINGLLPLKLDQVLKEKKSKLTGISLSIDGLYELHNKIRGRNDAFELALKSLKILEKYGISPGINMTLSPLNYHQLYKTYKFFEKTNSFTFKIVQESKEYFGNNLNSNLNLTTEMKQSILNQIQRMNPNSFNPYVLFLDEWMFKKQRPLPCYAGISSIFINANGDVFPCVHKSAFGNLRDKPLGEIWFSKDADIFRRKHKNCSCCYERCTVDSFRIDVIKWAIKCKFKKIRLKYSKRD